MKTHWLVLAVLLVFSLAACSSPSRKDETTDESATDNRGIPDIAPEGRNIEEAVTNEPDSSLPVMTADSPPILLTPIQGNAETPSAPNSLSLENWQTFTSSALGVAVDYPLDWSVAEETDGGTFTSPQGTTITLQAANAVRDSNETRMGNQHCTSRTNQYNLTAEICVDNASFIYTAKFTLQAADSSNQWLTLTTRTRTTGQVFEGMFNSVRLLK
jgi:hypothetical protein